MEQRNAVERRRGRFRNSLTLGISKKGQQRKQQVPTSGFGRPQRRRQGRGQLCFALFNLLLFEFPVERVWIDICLFFCSLFGVLNCSSRTSSVRRSDFNYADLLQQLTPHPIFSIWPTTPTTAGGRGGHLAPSTSFASGLALRRRRPPRVLPPRSGP